MMRAGLVFVCTLCACGDNLKPGGDDTGGPDAGGHGGDVTAVTLVQAVSGAMWVDPDAYPTIPIHIVVIGTPMSVAISLDSGAMIPATADATAGNWTAQLDVSAVPEGDHVLVAVADHVAATATLGIGRQGIQFTNFGVDQNAATPRLHRSGDHLYLTWTDIMTGTRVAWLQEIDGEGRGVGDRVALVGGVGKPDVLYARTAFGAASIGVLYQQNGGPYENFFTIVGPDGTSQLAPIALDPTGRFGSYGGDITYDGTSGFDVVWRTNDGMGNSQVQWMHVDEASATVTGSLVAAAPGHDDPHGGFDPIMDIAVLHDGSSSLVAFKRYEYNTELALEVSRCQVATITNNVVAEPVIVEIGNGMYWDDDCRILTDGTSPVAVAVGKSLLSNDDNPPEAFHGVREPLPANRGDGAMMVTAPEDREEPNLVPTAAAAVLAWSDSRSYAVDETTGQIQIYAAPIGADLVVGTQVVFAHTHVIESSSDIHGAAAGTNAILGWIDERHGGSVVSPRPEVYLETVWQ